MEKLIFVYNADSGKANSFLDTMHKIFRPSTYSCKLCALTYGKFAEKTDWKKFREGCEIEMEFLHRDEFQKKYASKFGYKFEFPIILINAGGELEVFMSKEELTEIRSSQELIQRINSGLNN